MNSEGNANNQSRSEQRSKRKKTNLILNSLIVIVILLIVFVSYTIFGSKDETNGDKTVKEKTVETKKADNTTETVNGNTDESANSDEEKKLEEDKSKTEEEAIVTEGGSDSNVVKTIENPSWKSVGTTQTGEHRAVYSDGPDWDEQVKALAYGSGLDESDMVVWFLGNNNHDPQKSIGTVSSKDKSKKYRVYIEWVDQQGWKPIKVEEIKNLNIR
ncbi:YrrS family protein [Niallia sp. NCCP-28]|uniref:YrrS family protein n=1 Tax=Niallia sp. NCCP-28 TaxID=2934712 RepID=UPI002083E736|nr:YrrS family protein [Niallia sp. NCCP-28]GKU81366.1 putative membrane protein YrrS [Niallia sp. NCCP-28]